MRTIRRPALFIIAILISFGLAMVGIIALALKALP